MNRSKIAHFLVRLGVAFAFLYPPIAEISDPNSWFSYFPRFIRDLPLSPSLLLTGFGLIEAGIAVWILSGNKIRVPAALAGAILVAIVAFNVATFDVVFRDLSIAAMAVALVFWPNPSE